MELTVKKFVLHRTHDGKRFYIKIHNTINTSYSGQVGTTVICNMMQEAKDAVKDQPDTMIIEEAHAFFSVTLINTRPSIVLVIKDLRVGEWKEEVTDE